MRTTENHTTVIWAVFVLAFFWTGIALGQTATGAQPGQSSLDSRTTIGAYLGFTDRLDADFTYGAELEHRLDGPWSVGALVEHTPDVYQRDDVTLVMGTANIRPLSAPRLKLSGGAGVEFNDRGGDDLRFRTAAGYDFIIEGPLTVTPRIAVDFGDGDENISIGATAFYQF